MNRLTYGRMAVLAAVVALAALGCTTGEEPAAESCYAPFELGDPVGHADPLGAKAAGQARAGRIDALALVPQPAHGRQPIEQGDYLLVNDKIAVVVEQAGLSDGYSRFGGDILSLDLVGDDGQPLGLSRYNETLLALSMQAVEPTSVAVLRDGSDGGPAIVRAVGKLAMIPFLAESVAYLFPNRYDFDVALDYVLEPDSEKLVVRLGLGNPSAQRFDLGVERASSDVIFGFFHYSQHDMVTGEHGFGEPTGPIEWIGFDGHDVGFAFRVPDKELSYGLTISGFSLVQSKGFFVEGCGVTTVDHAEIVVGGPDYDGLRQAIARESDEPAWREVTGTVSDGQGNPLAGAWVHELDEGDGYLSRTRSDASGAFTIHAPAGQAVKLVPQLRGYPTHAGSLVAAGGTEAPLAFAPNGVLHVTAMDAQSAVPLPVRVQVLPTTPEPATPARYGVADEVNGRLHQEFAVTGEATLPVPPGEHRVIVTRGYEYEMLDTTITVAGGETLEVPATLQHSVDSTGVMCADFHIHSWLSADSEDSIETKVKGAVADGLDIPCSSEHEWVVDFGPVVEALGLEDWAYGMASEELTTFTWGHFGVVPMHTHPGAYNHGAVDWVGRDPGDVFGLVRALPDAPALIVNHPRSGGFGGYFSAMRFDRELVAGKEPRYSDDFDALEVFNDTDVQGAGEVLLDWFSMLNAGRRIFAVGNSDSHHLRTSPVGYARTCFEFGHDDPRALTPTVVRDAILSGDGIVSGGLMMKVEAAGGGGPGDTVATTGGSIVFTVTVESPSWIAGDTLETFVDGASVGVEPLLPLGAGPSNRYVNQVTVNLDPSAPVNWVAFHAKGLGDLAPLHPGRRPFAFSNPVFLE